MKFRVRSRSLFFFVLMWCSPVAAIGQVDEICREFGAMPMLESNKLQAPFIYGKISVIGVAAGAKLPKITVTFSDSGRPSVRQTVDRSGNYCFKRASGDGILVVDVNGVEFARKTIPAFGQPQQREDFEVQANKDLNSAAPGVVSAKFSYARGEGSIDLFRRAVEAERNKDPNAAIELMKRVLVDDPKDFIAWAKLGALYFDQNSLAEAEAAFKRSLELRVDYTPSWLYMGRIRASQKHYDIAVEIFKQAIETDARSARAYQLLGETYLQAKKGSLGAEALNKAIELDPEGMAECHLLLARLYDLAGAKNLASKEYKAFITKRPDHPDKTKFEKYVKDNPETN